MTIDILLLIVSIALLYWGAERLVSHSSWLAKGIGISPLIIGSTVIAFGTSAPELLVSTIASLEKNSAIALGNVIGSNIANRGLILGLVILFFPPKPEERAARREFPFLVIVSLFLFIFSLDGSIGRFDGLMLIALFVVFISYNIMTVRKRMLRKFEKEIGETEKKIESIISRKTKEKRPLYNLLFSLIGLTMLLAGSHLLVKSAVSIAASIGVSQMVIGLSIVALGTSLPELVVSVVASIKKEERINLGMVLGSNTFNTLLILGVAALILPIPVEKRDVYINMPIMLLFTIAVFPVLKENIKTYRLIGLFFLLGYFSFIFYSFFG